jgi:hypothetical protein
MKHINLKKQAISLKKDLKPIRAISLRKMYAEPYHPYNIPALNRSQITLDTYALRERAKFRAYKPLHSNEVAIKKNLSDIFEEIFTFIAICFMLIGMPLLAILATCTNKATNQTTTNEIVDIVSESNAQEEIDN